MTNKPVIATITMEDAGQSPEASRTTLVAAQAFADACNIPEPDITNGTALKIGAPDETRFTMEDGGQSLGATETSQRAAHLLAHLDDEDETPTAQTVIRPCVGMAPYCC